MSCILALITAWLSSADVLLYAPELLSGAEDGGAGSAVVNAGSLDARLLLFQLLSALAELHASGRALGSLQPEDVLLHGRQLALLPLHPSRW
jgi:hypothetical protein